MDYTDFFLAADTNQVLPTTTGSFEAFMQDSAFKAVPAMVDSGEQGVAVPYSVRTDNLLTFTLLLCFCLAVVSLAASLKGITRQLKKFFFPTHETIDDESSPTFFLMLLSVTNCILLAITLFIYAEEQSPNGFVIKSHLLVITIFEGLFTCYFLVKWMAYSVVNNIFFGSKKSLQWNKTFLLLVAVEGLLMFPIVMVLVYFGLEVVDMAFFFLFVLFLNKMLVFYKEWGIFFKQNPFGLQFFLYFCALEIVPLLALVGGGQLLLNTIKVNF